jgi:hypothetical protein
MWFVTSQKNGASALGRARLFFLGHQSHVQPAFAGSKQASDYLLNPT